MKNKRILKNGNTIIVKNIEWVKMMFWFIAILALFLLSGLQDISII